MNEVNARLLLEEYYLDIKDKYSNNTVKSYMSHIELVIKDIFKTNRLENISIKNLEYTDCLEYHYFFKDIKRDKNYSNATINNKTLAMSSFYEFLIEKEYLKVNHCVNIEKLDYNDRNVLILSKEEMTKLKLASDDLTSFYKNDVDFVCSRARAMIYLLLDTGLKSSEIMALNDDMVDYDNKIITINNRKITIGKDTSRILRRYVKRRDKKALNDNVDNPLFVSNRGKRISKKVLQTTIDIIATKCNYNPKDVTASSIRASYFYNLRKEGVDIKELFKISGYNNEIAFIQYLDELETIIENNKK